MTTKATTLEKRAGEIIGGIEKYAATKDYLREEGFQFDIKLRKRIDIPDEIRSSWSAEDIDEVYSTYIGSAVETFIMELIEKYGWIESAETAGQTGGWLVITDKNRTASMLKDVVLGKYDEEEEDAEEIVKDAAAVLDDLREIEKAIEKGQENVIQELESPRFWREFARE